MYISNKKSLMQTEIKTLITIKPNSVLNIFYPCAVPDLPLCLGVLKPKKNFNDGFLLTQTIVLALTLLVMYVFTLKKKIL
jgi:hypothetical protein